MPTGYAPAFASQFLNVLNGTSFTPPAGRFGQLHIGDPGVAGTANQSAVTTREAITYSTSASGSPLALSNTPTWPMTATEAIAYISVWDSATGGAFKYSLPVAVIQGVNAGDTVVLDNLDITLAPQAA
jgi:hypothetical protein